MCLSVTVGCLTGAGFVEVSGFSSEKIELFLIDGAGVMLSSGFLPCSFLDLNEPEHDAHKVTIIVNPLPQKCTITTKVFSY